MKRIKLLIAFCIVALLTCTSITNFTTKDVAFAKYYSLIQINGIFFLVRPSAVYAELNSNTNVYKGNSKYSTKLFLIEKGTKVEIIRDDTLKWYYIKDLETKKEGWVEAHSLNIPEDSPTNKLTMRNEDIEAFINYMNFDSDTGYFVWTDIDRQLTHIFTGKKGNWKLNKTFNCSTGKNISPSLRGTFKFSQRGLWFYSERLKSGAKYWIRYEDSYLFHSVAMDKNKNITDPVIGEKRSSGCIRFEVADIKWIYENVPDRTTVFIY